MGMFTFSNSWQVVPLGKNKTKSKELKCQKYKYRDERAITKKQIQKFYSPKSKIYFYLILIEK